MKKRTILSLAVTVIIFAVIAIHLQKEASAETQQTSIYLFIKSTDGELHGNYTASLINAKTGQIVLDLPGQKFGNYPSIHGGQGLFPNEDDVFFISVCSDQNWGEVSPQFKITDGEDIEMTIEAHYRCPHLPAVFE